MTESSSPPKDARAALSFGRVALALSVALVVMIGAAIFVAHSPPPRSPDLDGVSLDLPPPRTASAPLTALLRQRPGPYVDLPAVLVRAQDVISRGERWPDAPSEVAAAIAAVKPPLGELRATLLAPGCTPSETRPPTDEDQLSPMAILRVVRLLGVSAVVEAQLGRADAAAGDLLPVVDRLLEIEGQCRPDLIAVRFENVSIVEVQHAFGYLLAVPTLDATLRAKLFERLVAIASRASPLPDAMRWEVKWRRALIESDFRAAPELAKTGGLWWPWYDRGATLALSDMFGRRQVRVAELPPYAPELVRASPEESYLIQVSSQSSSLAPFRYNSVGTKRIAIADPAFRRDLLGWHQRRCETAARRLRWTSDLRARGATVADPGVVTNPLTGKQFPAELPLHPCVAPTTQGSDAQVDEGAPIPSLPAAPTVAPPTPPAP